MTHEQDPVSYLDWAGRGRAAVWRYLVGAVIAVIMLFFIGAIPSGVLAGLLHGSENDPVVSNLVILSASPLTLLLVPLMVRLLHKRPAWSVFSGTGRVRVGKLMTGLVLGLALGACNLGLYQLIGVIHVVPNPDFSPGTWLVLLAVAGIGIALQATTEEMVFRGYLTQALWSRIRTPWIVLPVIGALFAAPHLANVAALGGAWLAFLPYFASGLYFGIAAYRSGSVWLGAGLHWANNVAGVLLFGIAGDLDVLKSGAPWVFTFPSAGWADAIVVTEAAIGILIILWLTRGSRATLPGRTPDTAR